MKEKFKDIDINNEKVKRIINCALEEFSKNKFEKASTNNIVKAANVSRGLMYHYFKDKQELFEFLIDFSITIVVKEFKERFDWSDTDLLNRFKQVAEIKLELFFRYPYLIDFYVKAVDEALINELKNSERLKNAGIHKQFYMENIDRSKFKDDIDVDKAINVIRLTLKKNNEENESRLKSGEVLDTEEIFKEYNDYIEFFRKVFYK
ncbi:MAG: TetR/AcrR family transcriptional regulator [Clostridia bacterium]|nr:TetR/AcrR family transcriptional regulator [Clostridia bacterium]